MPLQDSFVKPHLIFKPLGAGLWLKWLSHLSPPPAEEAQHGEAGQANHEEDGTNDRPKHIGVASVQRLRLKIGALDSLMILVPIS